MKVSLGSTFSDWFIKSGDFDAQDGKRSCASILSSLRKTDSGLAQRKRECCGCQEVPPVLCRPEHAVRQSFLQPQNAFSVCP